MKSNPGGTTLDRATLHRRAFLGTTALALPVVIESLGAQASTTKADAVTTQVEREIAATVKRALEKTRGEHLRALAASLRVLDAHCGANGFWATADKDLARLIGRRGGAANLALSGPDRAAKDRIDAAIRAQGIEIPHDHRPTDTQALTTALERLHKNGYSKTMAALATSLDRFGSLLDHQPQAPVVVIAARQPNVEICNELFWNMIVADAACISMSIVNPVVGGQLCILAYFLHYYFSLNGCG